jgi:large subunit ribosomal protein L18
MLKRQLRRKNIHYKIRKRVKGTAECPRLSVFRSNKQIYVQLIDDIAGQTLLAASTAAKEMQDTKGKKVEMAKAIGKALAEKAIQAGYKSVIFDRSGYLYHGRVKALAEGAREGGLQF